MTSLIHVRDHRAHRSDGGFYASHWALPLFVIAGLCAACGGTQTGPSDAQSFIAGTWSGTITIERTGEPASSGKITWSIRPFVKANEVFVAMQSTDPWWPLEVGMTGTVDTPTQSQANITVDGAYPSPRGCVGTIVITGVADARRINADLSGVDCPGADPNFTGRIVLTKD